MIFVLLIDGCVRNRWECGSKVNKVAPYREKGKKCVNRYRSVSIL